MSFVLPSHGFPESRWHSRGCSCSSSASCKAAWGPVHRGKWAGSAGSRSNAGGCKRGASAGVQSRRSHDGGKSGSCFASGQTAGEQDARLPTEHLTLLGMAHAVTYVELYFRRLEVLRRLYKQHSEAGSSRDVGIPGDRRVTPKARSEVAPSANHGSETGGRVQLSGHAESTEAVSTLENSGLISAHVPERVTITVGDRCGPFCLVQRPQANSAIPPSPSAVKRYQKREQLDHSLPLRSKIPRHPMPYDAWAIRSHPLAFGVIKLCQIEEGAVLNRKRKAGEN